MKTIVTHHYPDVDAVTAVWLVKTFYPDWEEADIAFVPAGETLGGKEADSEENILHVDTGLGQFDHHQTNDRTSAARLVFEYLREAGNLKLGVRHPHHHWNEKALDRLTMVVVDIDHFGHVDWPNPTADIYDFGLESMLDGWKLLKKEENADREVTEWGMRAVDGIYHTFVNKVWAEEEIKTKGILFDTVWGKAIGIETMNDDTISLAQKQGCVIAIRKDPHKGYLRVKARPGSGVDLTPIYNQLKKSDKEATWFFHVSKLMILNGSHKNPKMKATTLSLVEVIEIIKESRIRN